MRLSINTSNCFRLHLTQNYSCESEQKYIKVFHSSAFQSISRRLVYINYSGSVLKKLKYTMQTKHNATKKPHSNSNINKILQGVLAENVENLHFFIKFFTSWNCIQYISISRGAVCLMRQKCLKQESNNILKQFLYFLSINFVEKMITIIEV